VDSQPQAVGHPLENLCVNFKVPNEWSRWGTSGGIFSFIYFLFSPFCIGQHFSQSFSRCCQGQAPLVGNKWANNKWNVLLSDPKQLLRRESGCESSGEKGRARRNGCEISVGQLKNAPVSKIPLVTWKDLFIINFYLSNNFFYLFQGLKKSAKLKFENTWRWSLLIALIPLVRDFFHTN